MASGSTVRLTANFEKNLESIRAFLDERDAIAAFQAIMDDLFDRVIPNLERFPDIGVDFYLTIGNVTYLSSDTYSGRQPLRLCFEINF